MELWTPAIIRCPYTETKPCRYLVMLRKGEWIPLHPTAKKWSLRGQFPLVLETSSVIVQNRK